MTGRGRRKLHPPRNRQPLVRSRFGLADHIKVTGAELKDGLLEIELVREIPEAMKPRKIEIGGGAGEPRHDTIEAKVSENVDF